MNDQAFRFFTGNAARHQIVALARRYLADACRMARFNVVFVDQQNRIGVSARFRAQHQHFLRLLAVRFRRAFLDLRDAVDDRRRFVFHNGAGNHVALGLRPKWTRLRR